jgi:hypothetical protein
MIKRGYLLVFLLSPLMASFLSEYPNTDQYFPIWSAKLFPNPSNKISSYLVRVQEIDGVTYDNNELFYLLPTLEASTFSPSNAIDLMGRWLEKKNQKFFNFYKKMFEFNTFKKYKNVKYSIHKITWIPLERFKSNEVNNELFLGRFVFEKE